MDGAAFAVQVFAAAQAVVALAAAQVFAVHSGLMSTVFEDGAAFAVQVSAAVQAVVVLAGAGLPLLYRSLLLYRLLLHWLLNRLLYWLLHRSLLFIRV